MTRIRHSITDAQRFYIVWNPERTTPPRYRHDSLLSAIAEAKRLADANPGQSFIVLASMGEAKKVSASWTRHSGATPAEIETDDIPF